MEKLNLLEKANLLNECKYFFCYDLNTAFIPFAILCGCIPILYSYDNYTKETWLNGTMLNKDGVIHDKGIAWGNSITEINFAKNSLLEAANDIISLYQNYNDGINLFLDDIRLYFENNDALTNTVKNIYLNTEVA